MKDTFICSQDEVGGSAEDLKPEELQFHSS